MFVVWWLVLDLVFAVIVRLQMLHVESIVRRTNSTEMQCMTDLQANICTELNIKRYNIMRSKRFTLLLSLRAPNWCMCRRRRHLEETAQSFIDNHLDSLNLLRKNIWGYREKTSQIKNIKVISGTHAGTEIFGLFPTSESEWFQKDSVKIQSLIFQIKGLCATNFFAKETLLLGHENCYSHSYGRTNTLLTHNCGRANFL